MNDYEPKFNHVDAEILAKRLHDSSMRVLVILEPHRTDGEESAVKEWSELDYPSRVHLINVCYEILNNYNYFDPNELQRSYAYVDNTRTRLFFYGFSIGGIVSLTLFSLLMGVI